MAGHIIRILLSGGTEILWEYRAFELDQSRYFDVRYIGRSILDCGAAGEEEMDMEFIFRRSSGFWADWCCIKDQRVLECGTERGGIDSTGARFVDGVH